MYLCDFIDSDLIFSEWGPEIFSLPIGGFAKND